MKKTKLQKLITETMAEMSALQQQSALGSWITPTTPQNVPAPGVISKGKQQLPINNENEENIEDTKCMDIINNILSIINDDKITNKHKILKIKDILGFAIYE